MVSTPFAIFNNNFSKPLLLKYPFNAKGDICLKIVVCLNSQQKNTFFAQMLTKMHKLCLHKQYASFEKA